MPNQPRSFSDQLQVRSHFALQFLMTINGEHPQGVIVESVPNGRERALDRACGVQIFPALGGEIVESQQRLTILDQALDRPLVFHAKDLRKMHRARHLGSIRLKNRSWSQRCVNPASTTHAPLRKISVSEPAKV